MKKPENPDLINGIAVVGMAGRFPGAKDVNQFWQNQRDGVESISRFNAAELEVPGADRLSHDPRYICARPVLADVDLFDAAFFGIYPKEAEFMDPQHRVFLECCWEAIEDAGYDPLNCPGMTAVYAGCSPSTYFLRHVCADRKFIEDYVSGYQVANYQALLGSNGDFLATRVAYKLNLKGPAFTLLAGCSTSLVAVCQASQALQSYQCDSALAGGVSITFPQKRGYLYEEGGMVSPDGHCRTFDENANGTVFGSGSGVVLLKRLEDALSDGDHIYAVIRGYAVNNDGAAKVGYTAPSVEGQAKVIAMAQAAAGVGPETISYIEAHGTGTPLGDPIEIAALTQAFRAKTQARQFCAIGSAKTTVGHLDIAAGITGLIRTVQALRHRELPPTLHFRRPNSKLNLEDSPFYVNAELQDWKSDRNPRRAGVSAFGVGGTNAHVILEESPEVAAEQISSSPQLLLLSAKNAPALDKAAADLANHFESHPEANLVNAAQTLQIGRHHFEFRRMLVASEAGEAVRTLRSPQTAKSQSSKQLRAPNVSFLFPGQGVQYAGMGAGLYHEENIFREAVDRCAKVLQPHVGFDLRSILFPADSSTAEAQNRLTRTECAQPGIFTIEYALAQLWISWGIKPQAMIGHSVGEFVAATLAGVYTLEDALALVAARGRMMQELPAGGMLSVRLPEAEVRGSLNGHLSIAAVNSPKLTVVAGPFSALDELESEFTARGIMCRKLAASHAFHSVMMEPIIEPFTRRVREVPLHAPKIPYISCVSGTWVTEGDVTDARYWARHFREAVQFSPGICELLKIENSILLEVGPGSTLSTLTRQHEAAKERAIVTSLPQSNPEQELPSMLQALGSLWLSGAEPNWNALHRGKQMRRISLPTYPFQRKRYWIEPPAVLPDAVSNLPSKFDNRNQASEMIGEDLMSESILATEISPTRRDRIGSMLREIFEELSGMDLASTNGSATFLELGLDSLFLTQVTQSLKNKFGLKITFRQLLDEQSSLDTLAEYVDTNASPEMMPQEPAKVMVQPTPVPKTEGVSGVPLMSNESSSSVERIVKDQLQMMSQLMTQQLEMLRAVGAASVSASPAPGQSGTVSAPTKKAASQPIQPAQPSASPILTTTQEAKAEFKPFGPYKPPTKGTVGELTTRQDRFIKNLIDRYTRRTAGSKRMTQEYRQVLADPRVVSSFRAQWKEMVYPIVAVRSSGSRLWDIDGNEYIDILNGFGPTVFGHGPKFVIDAVKDQLEQGFEIGPQSPLAGKVAKTICELTGNERATFCNTGSEAVMAAIRIARTVTGRSKVVLFAGAYHGTFDEVLVKGIRKAGAPHSLPIAPGIPNEKVAHVVVLDYGTPESLDYIRSHANELAAVLVEPVQSRHPALQPKEFVREIREITAASGTALIFDEVVTGFRIHPGGVQAMWNIRADLATYGKVLGGGLPIGVLAGKAAFMDALDGGAWRYGDDSSPEVGVTFFAGTFVRHPLALAATWSVLNHLKEAGPHLQENLNAKADQMVARLNEIFERNEVPTRIQNFGSFFYFSFAVDQRFGSILYYLLREKGVHLQEGFPCFLTTAHSDNDVERIIRAFQDSITEMQEGELLPKLAAKVQAPDVKTQLSDIPSTSSREELAIGEEEQLPLTESQLEVFLSAQLDKEASCSFNESISLRMDGHLNEGALRKAIQQLIDRHEAFRTRFNPNGEFQRFARSTSIDTPLLDLSSFDFKTRDAKLKQLVADDARIPFDLVNGPLVRTQLVRLEQQSHVLLFTTHHIVCDGWSINVVLDELSKLYTAASERKSLDLAAPIAFSSYARSQAEHFIGEEGAAIEKYWVDQFKKPAPLLDLPLDRPRPPLKSYDGATLHRKISAETYRNIKKMGAQQKCTLFVTLLAGFQALLSRLSGQDDIVVGIPAAGQSLLEDGNLIGHCVNFLPLRGFFNNNLTMAEYLAQVKRTLLEAYEHQNYTYGRLVRKLAIPRDPARLPLMEVQFNLERVGSGMHFSDLNVEVDLNAKAFVNHDIFLNVIESDDGLILDCDYNTRLFDEETIARWLNHYEALLEGFVADVNRPVKRLPLLKETERKRIVNEWNSTQADYPKNLCVHQLFERQVVRTPDAVAADYEGQQLTYAELNRRADQLSQFLRRLGVHPGVLVGVFVERSLDMIIALLGVMKTGGAYVPMDPTYPAERISFVLEDAKVPVLLTQEKLAQNLAISGTRLVYMDTSWGEIEQENSRTPDVATKLIPKADDLAYVIYTSGSTGKPKGVEIAHRAVVNLLSSMQKKPGLGAQDTLLAVTTLSFDIAGLELYLPLCVGAKLVIASREAAADGNLLLSRLVNSGATVIQATPITFRLLIEAGWTNKSKFKVLCGGEALPRDLANQILERTDSLWNMYGPTETTIWSSTIQVEKGDGPVSIGPPIDNTQFHVLDASGELAPIGVPSELHIGGDGLARGYFRRPELTAEKFIADPFRKELGARLYKTGDLVRRLADGSIDFLGRLDNQVKLRGYRIELGEIETLLVRYPGVREAAVILREDTRGDKRLVAYVVTDHQALTVTAVREFLTGKLPNYMLPAAVVRVEAMPLTPNGKVDRRGFPMPDVSDAKRERGLVAPRTAQEKTLAEIWAEVLRLDKVGIQDNLFELGADSLHIFQIAARANKAGIKVAPAQFLRYRTIESLLEQVKNQAVNGDKPVSPIVRVAREKYRVKPTTV